MSGQKWVAAKTPPPGDGELLAIALHVQRGQDVLYLGGVGAYVGPDGFLDVESVSEIFRQFMEALDRSGVLDRDSDMYQAKYLIAREGSETNEEVP